MNPRDYLVQASELVRKEPPSAADLRTAVSRSYHQTVSWGFCRKFVPRRFIFSGEIVARRSWHGVPP